MLFVRYTAKAGHRDVLQGELGISCDAVARHLRAEAEEVGDVASSHGSNKANSPSTAPTGFDGSRSLCEPLKELIIAKLNQGLAAQRIYQDLCNEHGFEGKYDSVRRFVSKLKNATSLGFRRIEFAPGEEAQIDFGSGAPLTKTASVGGLLFFASS